MWMQESKRKPEEILSTLISSKGSRDKERKLVNYHSLHPYTLEGKQMCEGCVIQKKLAKFHFAYNSLRGISNYASSHIEYLNTANRQGWYCLQ